MATLDFILYLQQQQQLETQENIFSSEEDLRSLSASSSTSASPLPLMKWDPLHTYKSTLTLQMISSLLTDRSSQSRGQEEEHRPHSSAGVFLNIPELVLTPDGATEPISFSSLNKDSMVELMLSADGKLCLGFSAHTIHIERFLRNKSTFLHFTSGRR